MTTGHKQSIKGTFISFFSLYAIALSNLSFGQVIISEYLEGPSNDKCIELFNTTGASINLSGYSIQLYFNGNTSATTVNLSGIINSCGTFVICNPNSNPTLLGISNQTSGSLNFNGDDAIALYNGGTLLDLFGNIGEDPGSEWTGVGGGTQNEGLIRTPAYCSGISSDPTGTGFPSLTGTNWVSAGQAGGNLGIHTNTCSSCSTPSVTITAGSVTGNPFLIDCTTDATGNLAFTTSGTFNSGNVFTVQLSDAAGNFSFPTTIGTLSGVNAEGLNPSGLVNITVPPATPSASGYLLRIISNNPSAISSNSSPITISLTGACTPPHITSVIINSCNGACPNEGFNELVIGTTGDYSIDVTASNFNILYGTTSPASTDYTDVLITNATTTANINSTAGCVGTFIAGTGATMPPGSSFILASNNLCLDALTWNGLCGQGPIYMIYQNDPNWSATGNFSNSTAAGMRYFRSSFTTTSGDVFTIDYNYDRSQNGGTDGDYVVYESTGGAPVLYGDDDCTLTSVILPIELIDFTGAHLNGENHLQWNTASEINVDYFELSQSINGYNYETIGSIRAAGNSNSTIEYRFIDQHPNLGMNYYRLIGVDMDGSKKHHGIIALNVNFNMAFYDAINGQIVLNRPSNISIYSTDGRLITSSSNLVNIPFVQHGMFYIVNNHNGQTQKILIH
ncbi:MAG: lamin tail domain-containing protein [Crocinitomicaceae bacterium]|nr:lamin tail domain-containing protein [Crocinitomicaceae bacterium]